MTDTNQPTEPNEVEFHEKVQTPIARDARARVGIVAGAAFLFVVGAVAAMGASPSPSTGADPAARPRPGLVGRAGSSTAPGTTMPEATATASAASVAGGFGGFGRFGFRDITITAINGSDLSLKTDDGWTRTITVTSTTTITKGGATITVGDLAVGDQIAFAQDRAADGTYTVTAIKVVLPTIVGEVTAIDGNTITVTQPGGTTATIHVDGDTTYQVNGAAGALSDIKVGSFIAAEGTQRTDGSLDAAAVRAGDRASRARASRAAGTGRRIRMPARRRRAAPADRHLVARPAARRPCGARAASDSHVVLSRGALDGRIRSTPRPPARSELPMSDHDRAPCLSR